MADAELLALLLRSGVAGMGVLQLAELLLIQLGGLGGLLGAAPERLQGIKGLGPAKRAELLAIMEVARRSLNDGMRRQAVFETPQMVKEYLQLRLGGLPHEVFAVLFLTAQQRLIACEEMFRGTLSQTSVYPREICKRALELNAAAVVLAHNHPSGHLQPSEADIALTEVLQRTLALVDVAVLDHILVSASGSFSFAETGLL